MSAPIPNRSRQVRGRAIEVFIDQLTCERQLLHPERLLAQGRVADDRGAVFGGSSAKI